MSLSDELARQWTLRKLDSEILSREREEEWQAQQRFQAAAEGFKRAMAPSGSETAEQATREYAAEIKGRGWDKALPSLIERYQEQDVAYENGRRFPEPRIHHVQLTEWLRMICADESPIGSLQEAMVARLIDASSHFGLSYEADTLVQMLREWGPKGGDPAVTTVKLKISEAAQRAGVDPRHLRRLLDKHQIWAEDLGGGWWLFKPEELDARRHNPIRRRKK
jgi:hypothetical protein